jgi:hypothetical protein
MLKLILFAILLLVIIALILAALKPNRFRIERSVNIKAPPETIFLHLNNFHAWEAWSPWEKVDPTCKRSYSGSESGIGAKYGWSGNKNIGQGCMEIIESTPSSKIVLKIDFIKPFEAHNLVQFTLQPQGDSTTITQAMSGANSFISKLMGMCFNMDKMVGDKYVEGLTALKTIAEKQA